MEPDNRRIADRFAVADVLAHYSYCLDNRQVARIDGEVFTSDAEIDYGYGHWTGAADLVAWIESVFVHTPHTMHSLSNIRVDLDGDRAHSSCYVTAWHWLPTDEGADPVRPADFVFGATYLDDLRCSGQAWRIVRRRVQKFGPASLLAGKMPDFLRTG
jgi:hypothetical protein